MRASTAFTLVVLLLKLFGNELYVNLQKANQYEVINSSCMLLYPLVNRKI